MGPWITLPVLSNGPLPVTYFQDLLEDLRSLAEPMYAEQYLPGTPISSWTFSSTSAFTNLDSVYYRLEFESYGNDLLAQAMIRYSHSASNGGARFAFALDGAFIGNTFGLAQKQDQADVQEVLCMEDIIPASAGTHVLTVQIVNGTVGNAEIWKEPCMNFWVWEL